MRIYIVPFTAITIRPTRPAVQRRRDKHNAQQRRTDSERRPRLPPSRRRQRCAWRRRWQGADIGQAAVARPPHPTRGGQRHAAIRPTRSAGGGGAVETNCGVVAVCCLFFCLSPPWPLQHCLSIYRQRRGRPSGARPRVCPPVAQAGSKRPHPTARPERPRLHAAPPRAPQRPLRWRPLVRSCAHVAPQWRQPPRGCAPTTPRCAVRLAITDF